MGQMVKGERLCTGGTSRSEGNSSARGPPLLAFASHVASAAVLPSYSSASSASKKKIMKLKSKDAELVRAYSSASLAVKKAKPARVAKREKEEAEREAMTVAASERWKEREAAEAARNGRSDNVVDKFLMEKEGESFTLLTDAPVSGAKEKKKEVELPQLPGAGVLGREGVIGRRGKGQVKEQRSPQRSRKKEIQPVPSAVELVPKVGLPHWPLSSSLLSSQLIFCSKLSAQLSLSTQLLPVLFSFLSAFVFLQSFCCAAEKLSC